VDIRLGVFGKRVIVRAAAADTEGEYPSGSVALARGHAEGGGRRGLAEWRIAEIRPFGATAA
jgi:hypothetical protein